MRSRGWVSDKGVAHLGRRGLHLDHVLFQPGALTAVSARAAMGEDDVREGMPNSRCPSDHALVAAVFEYVAPHAAAGMGPS